MYRYAPSAAYANRVGQGFGFEFDPVSWFTEDYGEAPPPPPPPVEQSTPFGEQQPLPPTPGMLTDEARRRMGEALSRNTRTSLGRGLFTELNLPGARLPPPPPPPVPGGNTSANTSTGIPGGASGAAIAVAAPSIVRTVGEVLLLTSPAWGAYLYTRFFG